ncbi:hypothetical protein TYRP_023294 [Tyrophagus putrescentiae]|nr:hypothetical protein TYRP_023294 [Tyrophagus putrescentiae]
MHSSINGPQSHHRTEHRRRKLSPHMNAFLGPIAHLGGQRQHNNNHRPPSLQVLLSGHLHQHQPGRARTTSSSRRRSDSSPKPSTPPSPACGDLRESNGPKFCRFGAEDRKLDELARVTASSLLPSLAGGRLGALLLMACLPTTFTLGWAGHLRMHRRVTSAHLNQLRATGRSPNTRRRHSDQLVHTHTSDPRAEAQLWWSIRSTALLRGRRESGTSAGAAEQWRGPEACRKSRSLSVTCLPG